MKQIKIQNVLNNIKNQFRNFRVWLVKKKDEAVAQFHKYWQRLRLFLKNRYPKKRFKSYGLWAWLQRRNKKLREIIRKLIKWFVRLLDKLDKPPIIMTSEKRKIVLNSLKTFTITKYIWCKKYLRQKITPILMDQYESAKVYIDSNVISFKEFYQDKQILRKRVKKVNGLRWKIRRIIFRRKFQKRTSQLTYIIKNPISILKRSIKTYTKFLIKLIAKQTDRVTSATKEVVTFVSTASPRELIRAIIFLILRIIALPAFTLDLALGVIIVTFRVSKKVIRYIVGTLFSPVYWVASEISDLGELIVSNGGAPLVFLIYVAYAYPPLAFLASLAETRRIEEIELYKSLYDNDFGEPPKLWRIPFQFPTKIIRDISFMHDFCYEYMDVFVYPFFYWCYIEILAQLDNRVREDQGRKLCPTIITRYLAIVPFLFDFYLIIRSDGAPRIAALIVRDFSSFDFEFEPLVAHLTNYANKFKILTFLLRIPYLSQTVSFFMMFGVARHMAWPYYIQYTAMQSVFIHGLFAIIPQYHGEIYSRLVDYPRKKWVVANRAAHLYVDALLVVATLLGFRVHFPFIHKNILVWIGPEDFAPDDDD
nr:hypothetical protein [Meringosphaera mediterranea]